MSRPTVPEWTLIDFDPHEDCDASPCDECLALEEINKEHQ